MRTEDIRHKEELYGLISGISRGRRAATLRGCLSVIMTAAAASLLVTVPLVRALAKWRFAPLAAWILFWGAIAAGLVYVIAWVAAAGLDRYSLAEALGRKTGRGNLFSSALEFASGSRRLEGYSPWFMSETVRRATRELGTIRGRDVFASAGRPGWMAAATLLSAAFLVLALADPDGTARAIEAVTDPSLSFGGGEGLHMRITGGDRRIIAGEDVLIEALKLGGSDGNVHISYSEVDGVWKDEPVEAVRRDEEGIPVYSHLFPDVRNDFECMFTAGEETTGTVRVTVLHRPVINRISATLEYPGYTGSPADTTGTLSGRIAALRGTKIRLEGETSRAVQRGSVIFASGRREGLVPRDGGFEASFLLTSSDTMRIEVVDGNGLTNDSPLAFPIVARDDDPPSVEILAPEDETVLPRSLLARVLVRSADDFGISSISLRYKKEGSRGDFSLVRILDGRGSLRAWEDEVSWQLDERSIFPGDRIAYYVESRDNNTATGPGISRTPVRILIAPSIAQVFAESRKEERAQTETMEDILEESEEVRERLDDLVEDLKATGEMDWEDRKESREILQAQKELGERVKEAAERLDETLQRLEDNRMTSMEVGRKMEEIRDLLGEIAGEEIKDALERFARMLDEIPESEISSAMEQVQLDSKEIADRLDRTIELLKQVLREERMEELVRRMEEMLEQQAALKDSTMTGDLDELARRQRSLEEEYGDLERSAKDFAGENSDIDAAEELQSMVREMDSASIDSMMSASAGQMDASQREESSDTQGNALSRMMSLFTEMGKCQMAVSARPGMEARAAIERAIQDIIEMSRQGENAASLILAGNPSSGLEPLLERQNVLREASRIVMNDLLEAGRKSSSVSHLALARIADALHAIDLTIQALQARRFNVAATLAARTPRQLNLAAIELLKSISSSGGGAGGSMQQMQQMLQQQNSIDGQLQQLLQSGGQGMSMQQRAQMARIAARQRKMGELMRQIAEESRGTGELLGKLDGLGEEMQRIAEMLEEGRLDNDVMKREQRILSRMLESQRSLNRRDYSRERISRTAGDVDAAQGSFVPGEDDETRLLLERIRNSMREKGPAEYEELIRAYFRALSGKVRRDGQR